MDPAAQPLFLTTRWTIVLSSRDPLSSVSTRAPESLCQSYWYPLYVFVRRQGRWNPSHRQGNRPRSVVSA